MTAEVRATVVLLAGLMMVRLSLTGEYLLYVRSGMKVWLLLAGSLLLLLGAVTFVGALRSRTAGDGLGRAEPDDGHAHGHHGQVRVGWLVLAPVATVMAFAPPALGSFGVDRDAVAARLAEPAEQFAAVTPAQARSMRLFEYSERSLDRSGASFGERPVILTGFVAKEKDGAGFLVARYQIFCCAADALSTSVRVLGGATAPTRDRWVRVTGTYIPAGRDGVPQLQATSVRPVSMPENPYE